MDVVGVPFGEAPEHLARVGVASFHVLGEQNLPVHRDVEDALVAPNDAEFTDDVSVASQQVPHRAHGTVGIVSGDAVREVDAVHRAMLVLCPRRPARVLSSQDGSSRGRSTSHLVGH